MKYTYPKEKLTQEQIIYLENIEHDLKRVLENAVKKYDNLAITPCFEVIDRKGEFCIFEDNAGFSIPHSFVVSDGFRKYVAKKIKVDFKECSILFKLTFRDVSKESGESKNETMTDSGVGEVLKDIGKKFFTKEDDGLPEFIPIKPLYDISQIILPEETKKTILDNLNIIRNKDLVYYKWGFSEIEPNPKTILNFYGPAGTGKTMCAHAVAKLLDKPLLALNYSEIESKYVGDAAKNLKKAFDTATELNAVMFFDEADSFLGKRIENVSHGSDQALNSLRSQMLILLEEFSGVVLFATNLVTNFDKAFESRILDHIKFDLPNREARAAIIKAKIPKKLPVDHVFTEEEYLAAADIIEGFSGREIKNAILKMLLDKAGKGNTENAVFSFKDLTDSLSAYKAHLEQLKKEENERLKLKIAKKLQEKAEENAALAEQKKKEEEKNSNPSDNITKSADGEENKKQD